MGAIHEPNKQIRQFSITQNPSAKYKKSHSRPIITIAQPQKTGNIVMANNRLKSKGID